MKNNMLLAVLFCFFGSVGFAQNINTLKVDAFEKKLAATKEKTILDVRTPEEFKEGHLSGAQQLDVHQKDFREKAAKLDKSKPLFVYCLGGVRSRSAASILASLGFSTIYNLEGGIQSWEAGKKPIVK
ncbi:MAG: rhodanese-like domain-containing protein [Bacteroidetes bacterium]|nr:rhodanese-like domain-containing protein [Bacteroidota bacterium]